MDLRDETAAGRPAPPRRGGPVPGWLLLAAILLFLSVGFLGSRGLGEPDEGRYVAVAHAMAESGDWLTPTLHGRPHLTKPPLTYWLVGAGLAVRTDEWGARAFLALCHLLLALAVARLGARLLGAPEGRTAGLVCATMLMPFAAASLVTPDALLTLLLTAALAAAWTVAAGGASRARHALLFWLLVGAAFLVKGPPALLAPGIVAAFAVAGRDADARRRLRALAAPLPVAAGAAVAAPWYLLAALEHPGLLRHWLEVELIGRTIADAHGRNAGWHQPFKLFVPALLAGTLPWSLAWPFLLRRRKDAPRDDAPRGARRFLWTWVVVTFAVFTASRSRGMLYVLPAFPAIAILTTGALLRHTRDPRASARRIVAAGALTAAALLAVRASVSVAPSHRDGRAHARLVAPHVESADDAVVVVVGRPLHSLEHYLDRRVEWRPVGRPPSRHWPPRSERDLALDDVFRREERVVVVASVDVAGRVADAARASGRPVERHPAGAGREIFVSPRRTSARSRPRAAP